MATFFDSHESSSGYD